MDHVRTSNPSNYGFTYSAEREAPPPEVGWKEKTNEIQLYSDNVIKESDTTESVDRESIANLGSTRNHWENIFASNSPQSDTSTLKKKGPPKWEVKFPNKNPPPVPTSPPPQTALQVDTADETGERDRLGSQSSPSVGSDVMESAIEREIRQAREREEILRAEKREQQKLLQPTMLDLDANAESDAYQPAYNELTEADRGSDIWGVDTVDGATNIYSKEAASPGQEEVPYESIIEREIRLQMEREAELNRQRKAASTQPNTSPTDASQTPPFEETDGNCNSMTESQIEQSFAKTPDVEESGESLITKELRELKMREEEIERLRSSHKPKTQEDSQTVSTEVKEVAKSQGVNITYRDVKVQPIADTQEDDADKSHSGISGRTETPIEREMRIARERENELRRNKGLPELAAESDDYFGSNNNIADEIPVHNWNTSQRQSQPSNTMRNFASSRLQQEVEQQKERELALRNAGIIASSSDEPEERIQPRRYMEVVGAETLHNNDVRKFVTSKRTSISSTTSQQEKEPEISSSPSTLEPPRKGVAGSGGRLFSYKEFKQTAESKIERELREMREREEELRTQRSGETPHPS